MRKILLYVKTSGDGRESGKRGRDKGEIERDGKRRGERKCGVLRFRSLLLSLSLSL
jgi:hypothetical protein